MANTQRERVIANPGKRRGPRNMSAKQIKYFGSARQKAALRAKRSRPAAKKRAHSHRVKQNAGTGEIVGFTLANTGRKKERKHMAATKKNRKSKAGKAHHHAGYGHSRKQNRKNPGHRRRIHRNPGGESITNIVTNAVFVIAGALGSKLLTQMVLGANNVGLIGYAGNAIAGGAMWFVTEKFMHNKVASNGVIAGTAVQIILRLINDYTPFGQYVSQLGMGDYQAQSFVTPQVLVDPYNSAQLRIPGAWLPAPAPPPSTTVSKASAGAGVSGYGGGALYGGGSALY